MEDHCRATPVCTTNRDTDYDGYPDDCDSCSMVFNPDQSPSACKDGKGVCPGNVGGGILWSPTSTGVEDFKSCPSPYIGKKNV